MFRVDDIDLWQPKTETELKIVQSIEEERKFRLRMEKGSNEAKDIITAYLNYKEFGLTRGSDLDLELMLDYVRLIVEIFERKAEEPGKYQDFCKGVLDACNGFLHQIICMHEAKMRLKQDNLNDSKQEVLDRERESRLI